MIPKIIHYCWFGKGLMPKSQRDCIKGWKRLMPDYQVIRWDESNFDLDSFPLAKYACEVKKYALASDVCRYNVLSEHGGIYLDTDVEVFQRFDRFLEYSFFTGLELYPEFYASDIQALLDKDGAPLQRGKDIPKMEILTSSMGAVPNLKLICDLRDFYNSAEATPERALHYRDWVNNDRLVATYLTEYGFKYVDETQHLDNDMIVFGTGLFGYPWGVTDKYEVSYHHNAATWDSERWSTTMRKENMYDKLGLLPLYRLYKRIKNQLKNK